MRCQVDELVDRRGDDEIRRAARHNSANPSAASERESNRRPRDDHACPRCCSSVASPCERARISSKRSVAKKARRRRRNASDSRNGIERRGIGGKQGHCRPAQRECSVVDEAERLRIHPFSILAHPGAVHADVRGVPASLILEDTHDTVAIRMLSKHLERGCIIERQPAVAVGHEEVRIEQRQSAPQRAARAAERGPVLAVGDREAERRAIAHMGAELIAQVANTQHDPIESAVAEPGELAVDERTTSDLDERFGTVPGEVPEACRQR